MEVRKLIFALLIFSFFIIGTSFFLTVIGTSSGQNIQDLSVLNISDQIVGSTTTLQNTFQTKITGIAIIDAALVTVSGFIQFIGLVFNLLFAWWNLFVNGIFFFLPVPVWVKSIVTGAIVLYILFEVISAI